MPDEQSPKTRATPGSDVFVSYASQDAAVADAIVEALEGAGLKCWIAPRDVVPGEFYAGAIVHAIDAARVVVLVLSESAAASQHVLREVERASSRKHPVVSFRTDLAPLPADLEYFINTSHWLDASTTGVAGALPKLVAAVQRAVGLGAAEDPARATGPAGPASPATPRPAPPTRAVAPPSRVVIALTAVIAVAFAYVVVDKFWLSKHQAAAPAGPTIATPASEKSIAVLPFVDMSEKKDQEYFADGMAEQIIDTLAKIPGLKVIGRTSSFQFKGRNEDLRTIGSKLNAQYVLEGSVRKVGNRVRVTAQLIDSRDGTQRWANAYDRPVSDVFQMQDEFATALVRALELTVVPLDFHAKHAISSIEAYDAFLRGRYALDRLDPEGVEQAVGYFQQALDLDDQFAPAAVYLGLAYLFQGEWGLAPPRTAFEKARKAADLAIKLDHTSAPPHGVLAALHQSYDWNWIAAEDEINQAIRLSPHDASVLAVSARQSFITGRLDDAARLLAASIARDPLVPWVHLALGWVQQRRGNLVEAEASARRTLEISPTYAGAHYSLGLILLARGEPEAALTEMQKESIEGGQLGGICIAYFALGRMTESNQALTRMLKDQAEDNAFGISEVYAFRGENDKAFEWLDRAYAQRDPSLYLIKGDPPFQKLASDPRYRAFLRKMNLPE